ncbi:MAG: hypothetical protein N2383_16380, partial [Caldilineales bacterium]|nr:hypothetical protein [Caldilineales bacterium]
YEYDPATRLLSRVILPGGRNVAYERDDFGRVRRVFDPKGNAIEYRYDDLDRVVGVIHPDGVSETFRYRPKGEGPDLEEHIDRAGRRTKFRYDLAGRLIRREMFDAAGNPAGAVIYTYNPAGQVTGEAFDGGDAVARGYDRRGRLEWIEQGGSRCEFGYDNADRLTRKAWPGAEMTCS